MTITESFAPPADTATHGEYRVPPVSEDRPLLRFRDRITADGSSGFAADAGRYHIYAGRFCPYAQRASITRSLAGLDDVVTASFVHGERDARGWAFREETGADPVNGFTFLRDAYEATEPGFDGHVSVPTLWDRLEGRVVSNDYTGIEIDLATQFGTLAEPAIDLYPVDLRSAIDELDGWIASSVTAGIRDAATSASAQRSLLAALDALDRRLRASRYLLDDHLTLADVRLFVTLVRFDASPGAAHNIVAGLDRYWNLWAYARDLYSIQAFRTTTDFDAFSAPGAPRADWDEPADRAKLTGSGAR